MSQEVTHNKIIEIPFNGEALKAWQKIKPIQARLSKVEPFHADMLPKVAYDYLADAAYRMQCPIDFLAVAFLCSVATVVGNRIKIAPKQNDDWYIVPNLWGGIIGNPSTLKSPALKKALAPIFKLESNLIKQWENENKQASKDKKFNELISKNIRTKANEAIKKGNHEQAKELWESIADNTKEKPRPRLIVNDTTVEKLGELLNENPRGLLIFRDELTGFLSKIEKDEYKTDRAFYLEAYNGDSKFTYDRIGRGTIPIDTTTLSMIGGIQPTVIAPMIKAALSGKIDDGLIQRFQLMVWPDDLNEWQNIDKAPNKVAKAAYYKLFATLHEKELGTPEKPLILRFSQKAQSLFNAWMEALQNEARGKKYASAIEAHLLKMPKMVASLALLFELIEGGETAINESAIIKAIEWAKYLKSHAMRLYSMGEIFDHDNALSIVNQRHKLPQQFSARHIHQKDWAKLTNSHDVHCAIEILLEANYIRELKKEMSKNGGRPSTLYEWNPELKNNKK